MFKYFHFISGLQPPVLECCTVVAEVPDSLYPLLVDWFPGTVVGLTHSLMSGPPKGLLCTTDIVHNTSFPCSFFLFSIYLCHSNSPLWSQKRLFKNEVLRERWLSVLWKCSCDPSFQKEGHCHGVIYWSTNSQGLSIYTRIKYIISNNNINLKMCRQNQIRLIVCTIQSCRSVLDTLLQSAAQGPIMRFCKWLMLIQRFCSF